MKHLQKATILIFGILGLSLPAMAQITEFVSYGHKEGGNNRVLVDLVVARGETKTSDGVSGTYSFNEKSCTIRGSYFPATGRLKARCENDEGVLDVAGLKLTNKDGFQLTIGNYSYAVLRTEKGVAGTWQIEQRGSGASYEGKLYLNSESTFHFTGTVVWNSHQEGRVKGEIDGDNVTITIYYPDGLEGYYKGRLGSNYTDMVDGTASSNKGGPTVAWTAKLISREKPGCKLEGRWTQHKTPGIPETNWTITSDGTATERGGGNASGKATLNGKVLRIDFKTNDGFSGHYQWALNFDCTSGEGNLVFKTPRTDTLKSSVKRN